MRTLVLDDPLGTDRDVRSIDSPPLAKEVAGELAVLELDLRELDGLARELRVADALRGVLGQGSSVGGLETFFAHVCLLKV